MIIWMIKVNNNIKIIHKILKIKKVKKIFKNQIKQVRIQKELTWCHKLKNQLK